MISTIEIEDEIGESPVIVNHRTRTYRVIGVVDVESYPAVGGYRPIPDSDDQF